MRTYAQLTTSFVVFCNRVGVDESISFWGGSEVIAPAGAAVFSAPLYDEGLFFVDDRARRRPARAHRAAAAARRAPRAAGPRAAAGSSPSARACADRLDRRRPAPSRGWTSPRREPPSRADRVPVRRPSTGRTAAGRRARSTVTATTGRPLFELPDRARDRHRRRAAGHRRVHPRPAAPGGLRAGASWGCRAASIRRSSRTSWPRRSAPSGCCAC